jgi:hypothetical protein
MIVLAPNCASISGISRLADMAPPAPRRALGALFLVISVFFGGIAVTAAEAGVWVVAVAAGVLALWILGLALRALRKTRAT